MLARNLSCIDRRFPKDRRKPYHLARLTYRGAERRNDQERRTQGWLGEDEQVVQCLSQGFDDRKIFNIAKNQLCRLPQRSNSSNTAA